MSVVQITSFREAILFTAQEKIGTADLGKIEFREIWAVCLRFDQNKEGQVFQGTAYNKAFARVLFEALSWLELQDGLIVRHYMNQPGRTNKLGGEGKRLSHITLTPAGREYIRTTIFAGQEMVRAGQINTVTAGKG